MAPVSPRSWLALIPGWLSTPRRIGTPRRRCAPCSVKQHVLLHLESRVSRPDAAARGQTFNLHSPNLGAYKNWISQGLVADKTVAVADLFIKGKSFGPHAFVLNLRENGKPVPGVQFDDMGKKTVRILHIHCTPLSPPRHTQPELSLHRHMRFHAR